MTRKYEQRVEFNWGYHDGASDVHNDRPIKISGKISPLTGKPWRPNRLYLHGYRYGVQDAQVDRYETSSQPAWDRYRMNGRKANPPKRG